MEVMKMDNKIVVVDDEEDNIELARAVLSSKGFEVVTFTSGKSAVGYLEGCEKLPALFVLDMRMPEMSGVNVCEELRKNHKFDSLKIVFFTASSDLDTDLLRKYKVLGFIYKPFDIKQLVEQVRKYADM
jgi:CheY-like chemotaxis protein